MKKLNIQWFIEQHSDWEKILQEKPYCLSITRDRMFGRNLIMFKYNQIETVWLESGMLAREARGIVLDEDTLEVVSYAFNKFFNSHEEHADEIDASSMSSSVKVDGSILKIVRLGNDVLISTNGTINAFNANVAEQVGCKFKSFGDIASDVIVKKFGSMDKFRDVLDEGYTYIFELVSPFTRVVTPYEENDMYLIGCRNNRTFEEIHFLECHLKEYFKTPEILDFSSIKDCLDYAQKLDWTNEGFVVMDKDFHRVKVKNASWLTVHHLCNNHVMSYERAIDIIKANELDEVIGYFPEFKENLEKIRDDYNDLAVKLNDLTSSLANWLQANGYEHENRHLVESGGEKRKDAALFITKEFGKHSGFGFALLDKKVNGVRQWLENMPSKNIVKTLGYKEST